MSERDILERLHRLEMKLDEQHQAVRRDIQGAVTSLGGDIDEVLKLLKQLLRANGAS